MLSVHMKSGASSLRASGTVIPYDDREVRMSFDIPMHDRSVFSLDVTFIFKEDAAEVPGFSLVNALENMNPEDIGSAAQYEITIHNCAVSGGVANDNPLSLVEFPDKGIYLNFIAESRGRSLRNVLSYSFYSA